MVAGVPCVTCSANEVSGLAAKAARGAGAPPAQATQFGAAAALHLGVGRAVDCLDAALAALPGGPIITLPLAIARIAETAQGAPARGDVSGAKADLLKSYLAVLPYDARLEVGLENGGTILLDPMRPAARPPVVRLDLDQQTYTAWSALAARILVPESEASRRAGAGAGTSDND